MTLALTHAAPDVLAEIVAAVHAALSANATYLAIALSCIVDTPVDPADPRDGTRLEVYARSESESFARAGHPISHDSEGQVGILICLPTNADGWETALRALRARVRAVLLQDPDFDYGRDIRRIDHALAFDGDGALVAGVCAMTVSFVYRTEYDPPAGVPLEGVDVDVDMTLGDALIDARLVIDLPQPT
jgi:hypothetical protein